MADPLIPLMLELRYDDSIAFLRRWTPSGGWLLSAIEPDRKRIKTRTFDPATEEAAAPSWIQHHGRSRNLYFHVNPARTLLSKKVDKIDVAWLCWLHVDVDPRVGETVEDERAGYADLDALLGQIGGGPT